MGDDWLLCLAAAGFVLLMLINIPYSNLMYFIRDIGETIEKIKEALTD